MAKREQKQTLVGTGLDPLARYPRGEVVEGVTDEEAADLLARGFVVYAETLPKPPEHGDFEQHVDPRGRAVLDRQLEPGEAAAQDEYHRTVLAENRRTRFGLPVPKDAA